MPTQNIYGVPFTKTPEEVARDTDLMTTMAGLPDSDIANGLFNTPMQTGNTSGNSRVYVGASPLQGLNSALRQGMGGFMVNQAQEAKKAMAKRLASYGSSQTGSSGYPIQDSPTMMSSIANGYNGPNGESAGS